MLAELSGFTLSRTVPDHVLSGLLSGAFKIYGGVVRDDAGRIVAHLVNSNVPNLALSSFSSPIGTALSAVNTLQLQSLNNAVAEVMRISQATMAISGLGLAISTAGFLFLNAKLTKIDSALQEIAKDVKAVRSILELQERGRLITALKALRESSKIQDASVKKSMLINSRQTLGEIHESYKIRLLNEQSEFEFTTVEEYFSITALGNAICSAELGMLNTAKDDLQESFTVWKNASRSFFESQVLTEYPERFLSRRYAEFVTSRDIIGWMDFALTEKRGIDNLDDLRNRVSSMSIDIGLFSKVSTEETINFGVARKLVARKQVLQGYIEQLKYLTDKSIRPSELSDYIQTLSSEDQVEGCYLFLSNEFATKAA